jgi:predicted nucleic acid-binding protein
MKKLKIYLDTSVYSALYDKRDLNRQMQTEDFWNNIKDYDLYFSDINIEEINGVADEELRSKLKRLLKSGNKIELSSEVEELKKIYISEEIIPERYENDATHIALTTVHSLDILISWNFKHIVKRKTRIAVNLINLKEGYKSIEILAPPEL